MHSQSWRVCDDQLVNTKMTMCVARVPSKVNDQLQPDFAEATGSDLLVVQH